ncbi:uncharacterized protein LOC129229757, partial [Uloborus diversus]|uniref:uncharacterized protein LOC129229757 n=1 Tax=Uloborus diversus TaxID=327109 RepID=UPI00240A47C6
MLDEEAIFPTKTKLHMQKTTSPLALSLPKIQSLCHASKSPKIIKLGLLSAIM